jgi:hypothetical protein
MKKSFTVLFAASLIALTTLAPANAEAETNTEEVRITSAYTQEGKIVLPAGSPIYQVRSWYPMRLPNNAGSIMRENRHIGLTYAECLINRYCDISKPVYYTKADRLVDATFDYDAYMYSELRYTYLLVGDGKVKVSPAVFHGRSYIECVASPTCYPFLKQGVEKITN